MISLYNKSFVCPTVKHTITYFSTVSDGLTTLPEVVAIGLIDDFLAGHCDSNINRVEAKQTWVKTVFDQNPEHLQLYAQECFGGLPISFKANIHSLKQRLNQSGGRYNVVYSA